jgi:glycosyltransferase involved in cell wall biosynthesis
MRVSAVIPAYNEETTIADLVNKTKEHADQVIVVNDCSSDNTALAAGNGGAQVISNPKRKGYISCIKKGFRNATADIIITLDADGEHNPDQIADLLKPFFNDDADLVLGKRGKIDRISERFLNRLTNLRVKVEDSGTGFRAIRKELALKLDLKGKCTCGLFALESASYGARIAEAPIEINPIQKKRTIAWHHFLQSLYILKWILFTKRSDFRQNGKN